ncbi:hypothetical protein [Culicoidibacter larvae]|uniref:Uncharacterized protein n=1 Tax=Culicoidibacter larvae TaxID=2579976 RepID=A0A5R8Q754_9FIRM|nr:hypothetical protein [Culicoidibacter larvae]TLG71173.1 hypothetical protein FEZ08_11505 [Culicoidibacter larvae]
MSIKKQLDEVKQFWSVPRTNVEALRRLKKEYKNRNANQVDNLESYLHSIGNEFLEEEIEALASKDPSALYDGSLKW